MGCHLKDGTLIYFQTHVCACVDTTPNVDEVVSLYGYGDCIGGRLPGISSIHQDQRELNTFSYSCKSGGTGN